MREDSANRIELEVRVASVKAENFKLKNSLEQLKREKSAEINSLKSSLSAEQKRVEKKKNSILFFRRQLGSLYSDIMFISHQCRKAEELNETWKMKFDELKAQVARDDRVIERMSAVLVDSFKIVDKLKRLLKSQNLFAILKSRGSTKEKARLSEQLENVLLFQHRAYAVDLDGLEISGEC